MGAPCACAWFARAAADLGEEPPVVADPDHPAVGAWFDRVIARLVDIGAVEPVTLDAPAELAGIKVVAGASVLAVDQGGRAYLIRAR